MSGRKIVWASDRGGASGRLAHALQKEPAHGVTRLGAVVER